LVITIKISPILFLLHPLQIVILTIRRHITSLDDKLSQPLPWRLTAVRVFSEVWNKKWGL